MTLLRALTRTAPIFLVASALAQSGRVCIGGSLEQLTPAQIATCQNQAQQVRAAAARYRTPAWHFVVVCDEQGWKDYAAFSSAPASSLENANADTNLARRTTFFRGSRLSEAATNTLLAVEMTSILRQTAVQVADAREVSTPGNQQ